MYKTVVFPRARRASIFVESLLTYVVLFPQGPSVSPANARREQENTTENKKHKERRVRRYLRSFPGSDAKFSRVIRVTVKQRIHRRVYEASAARARKKREPRATLIIIAARIEYFVINF